MIKVKVYWNLHKRCFSIQHRGKVIAHKNEVVIHFPEFKVSEAGRQRVLREKRKNVHAFIVGYYDSDSVSQATYENLELIVNEDHLVTYNPYKYETFVFANTDEPVYNADVARCVRIDGKGCIFV
jgi:hypothetical protein